MRSLFGLAAVAATLMMVPGGTVAAGQTAVGSTPAPAFTKDVAPILFNSCASCHRSGEVAPMSLLSYQDARPWAKAIKQKVVSREMPPWYADPHFSDVKFRNDRRLTAQQI